MRGQFYLVGALVLIVLLFTALPLFRPSLTQSGQDIGFLLGNVKTEYPRAANLGVNASAGPDTLRNFTHFLQARLADRLVNFSAFWLLAENVSGTQVNFTAGNFLGFPATADLNISGTVFSLAVPENGTNSTIQAISSVPYNLTINLTFESWTTAWYVNKTSLYAYLRLARGADLAAEEIEG